MKRIILHNGDRYGRLEVIEFSHIGERGASFYHCKCDCGTICTVKTLNLRRGATRSCGCLQQETRSANYALPLSSGDKFGRLTVLRFSHSSGRGLRIWECRCECGNTVFAKALDLKRKAVRSCGCLRTEILKKPKTHGMAYSRLNGIYRKMKQRCYNPKIKNYRNYGSRGITVCDECLNGFEPFMEWAINNGYSEELTLDRVNNDGAYSPENCAWRTYKEQGNNRRGNKHLSLHGETHTLAEWARLLGMKPQTLAARINRHGWDIERALTQPLKGEKAA